MNNSLQYICKYLSVYLFASLDITQALGLVCRRIQNKKLSTVFAEIQQRIQEGKNICDAFSILKKKRMIDHVSWSILSSAEDGGNIAQAFLTISKHIESQAKTKASLVGALAYPVGMLGASGCMIVFLITFAFPKIVPLFTSLNAPIPTTTKYILVLSEFIADWGVYMGIVFISTCSVSLYMYFKKYTFRYAVQSIVLHSPIIGKMLQYREYTSIASSVSILLQNNKMLVDTLSVVSTLTMYEPIKQEILSIKDAVEAGNKLSFSMEKLLFISGEWVDLISVGEVTGSLPQSFKDVSTVYEGRYTDAVQVLLRVSEPFALGITAIVVLIIALSVVTPMYSIIQQVQI